jgi:hypothetical protein
MCRSSRYNAQDNTDFLQAWQEGGLVAGWEVFAPVDITLSLVWVSAQEKGVID